MAVMSVALSGVSLLPRICASAGQMARPQLREFSALLKKVSPQIRSLNLAADLVVQSPLSFQQSLGMDLRHPIHERRAEAVHCVSQPHRPAEQFLHGVVGLAARPTPTPTAEDEHVC